MAVHKWTKLQTVLADLSSTVSADGWEETDALEWAFAAMRKIGAIEQYKPAIASIPIADYKGCLPDDLQKLHLAVYKLDDDVISETDLDIIRQDIGLDNDDYYTGFTNGALFFTDYRPLRLASSAFALSVLCDTCENLNVSADHTFTIRPDMSIVTSFEVGSVCLAYYGYAKDCDGNYLIPDDEDYLDALRNYIMWRYWERKWNMKEEGSDARMQYYMQRWQALKLAALGNIRMPDVNQLENLRQTRNRLVPKERWYNRGFGNYNEENLRF